MIKYSNENDIPEISLYGSAKDLSIQTGVFLYEIWNGIKDIDSRSPHNEYELVTPVQFMAAALTVFLDFSGKANNIEEFFNGTKSIVEGNLFRLRHVRGTPTADDIINEVEKIINKRG